MDPEDSDQCSMWSAQLPDTATSQAWGTAGVMGPLARWHHPLALAVAGLFVGIWQACSHRRGPFSPERTKVMSLAGPDEFVSVGVH